MSLDWWGELEGVEPTPGFLSQVSPDAPNVGSFEEITHLQHSNGKIDIQLKPRRFHWYNPRARKDIFHDRWERFPMKVRLFIERLSLRQCPINA